MKKNPFDDYILCINEKHGEENWITVYKNIQSDDQSEDGGMYCALVSKDQASIALSQSRWDVMIGAGGPGFCTSYENGASITTYYLSLIHI